MCRRFRGGSTRLIWLLLTGLKETLAGGRGEGGNLVEGGDVEEWDRGLDDQ